MDTWYSYRDAWSKRPSLMALAVLAVVVIVVAVVATVTGAFLALLFIPGLALLYLHHILVQRLEDQQ